MIPYIAILVVIIVAALFATYQRIDPFTVSIYTAKTISSNTSVGTLKINEQIKLNILNRLKEKYAALTAITVPTPDESKDILQGNTSISVVTLPVIRSIIDDDIKNVNDVIAQYAKLSYTDKVEQIVKMYFGNDVSGNDLNQAITGLVNMYNAQEIVFAKGVAALDSLYTRSTSGTSTTTTDASGNLAGVNLADLLAAIVSSNRVNTGSDETTQGTAPQMTEEYQKEMEKRIANSVATQVKDSLLSSRSTEYVDPSCPYATYDSDATQQGVEYVQGRPSPQPDMSQYVRKDSIPCWGCSLSQ